MKSKTIFFAIAFIMAISVLVWAEEEKHDCTNHLDGFKCNPEYDCERDFKAHSIYGGSSVMITGYNGNKWNITIPPQIRGIPVTHIGVNAFTKKDLISVNIPDGVTHIWHGAFYDNQLTKIIVPDSVTILHWSAFNGNPLISITIGHNVNNYVTVFNPATNTRSNDEDENVDSGEWVRGRYIGNFIATYRINGRAAGTYTRPDASQFTWTKE